MDFKRKTFLITLNTPAIKIKINACFVRDKEIFVENNYNENMFINFCNL